MASLAPVRAHTPTPASGPRPAPGITVMARPGPFRPLPAGPSSNSPNSWARRQPQTCFHSADPSPNPLPRRSGFEAPQKLSRRSVWRPLSSSPAFPRLGSSACLRQPSTVAAGQASGNGATSDDSSASKGNEGVQELLTGIVRLQAGQEEVNQFVAEKSQQLMDLAKDAGDDLEKIVQGANVGMEAANAKILEEIDSQVTELERELAAAKLAQEKRDQEFAEFERKLVEKQNEGLFFKSLYQVRSQPPPTKEDVLRANPELAGAVKQAARSPTRRNLYGVFAALALLTLAKVIADEASITTILACSAVCIALVFQVVYELSLSE